MPKQILRGPGKEFAANVDGIVVGIIEGKAYDTGRSEIKWPAPDRIKWARHHARYYRMMAASMENWAELVEKGATIVSIDVPQG